MRDFQHYNAESFDEASKKLKEKEKSVVISGGTDLVNVLKEEILEEAPDNVINLKNIKGADYIKAEENCIRIGALAKLADISESQVILKKLPILSKAAASVATPIIRNAATIGGNICQSTACEHYRFSHNNGGRKICYRKGGKECHALHEKNEFHHSVFGGMKIHNSPCTDNCPAGIDIPAYMERLRNDDLDGAAKIMMKKNPFASLTGRVCAHFCQETCNRNNDDESVAIRNVERYLGDYILENSEKYYRNPNKNSGKKVAIVGSGPAGLSAAYFLRKEGHNVVVYDRMEEAGGMLQYAIPAYRLPKNYVKNTVDALKNMGVEFLMNTEIGTDISPEKLEEGFDKVFYDTGAWKKPVIGIDGEELTVFGLDFLMEVKSWMEGKLGQDVLVVGGGNVAMDVASTAKRLGAADVTLVCVESEEEMPAGKSEINRCREEGIEIISSCGVSKVIRDGDKIKGMELVKCLSVYDENNRYAPVYDLNEKEVIEGDSIFLAVGQRVDLSFLDEKYQLDITPVGLVAIDEKTYMTSKKGVYAGGDMTSGPATVINAIASGHVAAEAINKDFGVEDHDECDVSEEPPLLKFDAVGITRKDAAELPLRLPNECSLDLEDYYTGLNWEQVKEETSRCYNCGCLAVNPSDISPVLVALDAIIKTTERDIKAFDFFTKTPMVECVLNQGELVKEIEIPAWDNYKGSYDKLSLRDGKNFAIVSVASAYQVEDGKIADARIVLGGVAPVPYPLREVETFVKGKEINEAVAGQAGKLACENAVPLRENANKLQEITSVVKNSLLNAVKS
jgi:NADPH-dependent glutamate synthase beta subunit-like oxidoreductase/CO/xanthine dehydrogenase FAD-binding subunit